MASVSSNWQNSLNDRLVNRLTRPLRQPGMIKMAMSQGIINRCDRFLNRIPLLSQQMQRWGNTNTLSYNPVPIVYAQPVSSPKEQEIGTGKDNVQISNQPKNQPSVPIIQRKEDSSQVKPVQKDNKTIAVQNLTDLSSSNFSDETTPSLSLETEIDQTSISSLEIPRVSPQPISEELVNTPEMPLPAKFIDTKTSSSTPSELNPNISSISSKKEKKIINQTSTSPSEIPVVSPQNISEELANTSSMPLQGKFIDSSNSSELNPNTSSTSSFDQTKIIDETSISPSEIPVVSPQNISEELANTSSMPLQGKFIDSSTPSELNPNTSSTSSFDQTKIIDETSISPSEIPVVSPQNISEELANTSSMPLQGKFIDSSTPSELNPNTSSTSSFDQTKIIDETSISPSEIPLVSPQPISEELANTPSPSEITLVSPQNISEELANTSSMPLQGKFIDSSTPSELNPNTSSTSSFDQTKIIDETSISPSEIPLVSPQPISEELANTPSPSEIPLVSPQSISEELANTSSMPLQAKFIDSSTPSQLNPNTSSTSSFDQTKIIDETSISPSEIPVVSPQPISQELANTPEMPLQAKFIDSSTPSELNQNTSSTSSFDERKISDETSISSSEIPVVSPQPISEELAKTPEMPLQAKFLDSSTPSELNPNTSSTSSFDERKISDETSISSSEIPVVSPQPISEELAKTPEMPLQAKFLDSSTPSELNPNTSSTSSFDETKIIDETSISPSEIPRVSPQPISQELANTSSMPLPAKFIDSQTSSSTPSQLNQNTSSTSSFDETKIIDETSISPSEIPRVSPQPISEELANTSSMPLPAKFIDSQTSSSTPSQLNPNTSSTSSFDEKKIIDETSISPSEIQVVSPQPISEELVNTPEMPLQGKFIDSPTPSELNPNTSSTSSFDETKIINQTSISPSEIPVVSPQSISQELADTSSMPLGQEFTIISEQPLPIIKAKQQNYSLSASSLPVVNPLNTLVAIKQPQQDNNYSTKINSIKHKNLTSQISSDKLPIVTTQPLTYQVNLTEKEISFARDAPNYQNQSFNISNSQIKTSNSNQKNHPLTTPISSPINSKLKSQPLPLYLGKNRPLSNSISQQPNLLNQNPIGANTNSSSSPKIYANPSPPTETSVSTMANQSNSKIDVDAIANKVERKLMRRLVIESERRGKSR